MVGTRVFPGVVHDTSKSTERSFKSPFFISRATLLKMQFEQSLEREIVLKH